MTANPEKYLHNKSYYQLIGGHREWLKGFDKIHLDAWDNLFKYNNPEAAVCEAATRQLLRKLNVDVEPCLLGGNDKKPDFKCQKDDKLFYVEATCVMKDTATSRSKLNDIPNEQSYYSLLTESFFRKLDDKESQFENLNSPGIIAIGTLHFKGGALCFDKKSAEEILTGKSGISIQTNQQTGESFGKSYNLTFLESAPFLKRRKIICNEPPILPTRQVISAVLLCPFGTCPPRYLGILHPKPYYEFERVLFPDIEFCRLKRGWEEDNLVTEWI